MSVAMIEHARIYEDVRPGGILADRIDLSLAHLLDCEERLCRYCGWGADQIGRSGSARRQPWAQ